MPSDKERLAKLEKQVDALTEISEREEREAENRADFNKFSKEQEKSTFKYALDIFKAAVVLAAILAGGSKTIDLPWVQALMK